MGRERQELQKLYSFKEKNENLLANLENLKSTGSLPEEQYNSIKSGYVKSINEATTAVDQIKTALSIQIQNEEKNAESLDNDLKIVIVRFKTGEIKLDDAQQKQERIRKQLQQKNELIADLKRLLASSNSTDVGGYIDPPLGQTIQAKEFSRSISSSDIGEGKSSIRRTISSPLQLIGPIGGVLLFISLFLPWLSISVSLFGYSSVGSSVSLFAANSLMGAIGLIAALGGIGSVFITRKNARGFTQLGMGIISLIPLVFGNLNSASNYGNLAFVSQYIHLEIGFYLYGIATVILILGGLFEIGRSEEEVPRTYGDTNSVKATFGLDENVASAACYSLGWVTGIIFFLVDKDNKTVRFHAIQSILTFLSLTIVIWVLSTLFIGVAMMEGFGFWFGGFGIWWMIVTFIEIATFLLWLFLMYKAYMGEIFLVPIVGSIAENQLK